MTLPLFQCLRKNDKFQWTRPCKAAFQKLKDMLVIPPIFTKPIKGGRDPISKDREGNPYAHNNNKKAPIVLSKQQDSSQNRTPNNF
ncbi:hypothetical protein CR513_48621, partial [Mucuna pruriens]